MIERKKLCHSSRVNLGHSYIRLLTGQTDVYVHTQARSSRLSEQHTRTTRTSESKFVTYNDNRQQKIISVQPASQPIIKDTTTVQQHKNSNFSSQDIRYRYIQTKNQQHNLSVNNNNDVPKNGSTQTHNNIRFHVLNITIQKHWPYAEL